MLNKWINYILLKSDLKLVTVIKANYVYIDVVSNKLSETSSNCRSETMLTFKPFTITPRLNW